MEEKVKLEYEIPGEKTIIFNGIRFKIVPFLSLDKQVALIQAFVKDYFKKNIHVEECERNYIDADINHLYRLIQVCTNIDPDSVTFDVLVDGNFANLIYNNISNYETFRLLLQTTIMDVEKTRKEEKSVGPIVQNIVDKAYDVISSLEKLSPEEIEKARQTGIELLTELEKNSVLAKTPAPEK